MSPAEYRRYAAECLRIAEGTGDPQSRASLLWLRLAKQAEKNLATAIVYETPEPRQHIAQQQQQPQFDKE